MSNPDDWLDADVDADRIENELGIPEARPEKGGLLGAVVMPAIIVGIALIAGLWFIIEKFQLLG
ncbi:hypothetical protein [Kozakia baliensis]|uniref:hypothetical protein n=1 Tax=Kozakia baliensis TaxID=153496 RepID=UPI0004957C4C|nr:hypothetical protein [Kozakia baliensis]